MASPEEAKAWAEKTLAELTLERKIAQIICSDLAGGYIARDDPRMEQWIKLARDYGIGMFVVYGGTPRDVAHLLNRLQQEAAIPLLISADFEGGPGQQVTGATEYPGQPGVRGGRLGGSDVSGGGGRGGRRAGDGHPSDLHAGGRHRLAAR